MKLPDAFGGQPFRFCCVRKVCVACKDGPRGGTSGGAGSGGESLPVSKKRKIYFFSIRLHIVSHSTNRVLIKHETKFIK